MPTGNLPAEGKKLWEKVYEEAKQGSCKGDESCAAASAWKAVKNAGWEKDNEGNWHKKADIHEFSLAIIKATTDPRTGERRWRAVASDTDIDSYGDKMTQELFADFYSRIEQDERPPEEFCSDFWDGGLPYLSISHYPDLNGKAVPGMTDAIYVDGNRLKARGRFSETPLGIKCYDVIRSELTNKSGNEDKIRISIAFLDYMHKHNSNGTIFERSSLYDVCPECLRERESGKTSGKVFLKGHLIHLALTRVPVNKRTSMEVERSMTTRKQDAASIIGEELAEQLDTEVALVGKSDAAVVIKSDEIPPTIEAAETVTSDNQDEEEAEKERKALNNDTSEDEALNDAPKSETKSMQPEVTEYKPYGGATSMEDAIGYEKARDEEWRINSLWFMLQDVMDNILRNDELEDKAKACKEAISEFQALLAAKSMVSFQVEKAELIQHPLDSVISQFKADYDNAVVSGQNPDDKLRLIQSSYAALGEKVIETIKKNEDQLPEPDTDTSPEFKQLASTVDALAQKVDLLVTALSASQQVREPKSAVRRSIQPTMNMQADILPLQKQPETKSITPNLRKLIEMTT